MLNMTPHFRQRVMPPLAGCEVIAAVLQLGQIKGIE
jgi:hypothetical protein